MRSRDFGRAGATESPGFGTEQIRQGRMVTDGYKADYTPAGGVNEIPLDGCASPGLAPIHPQANQQYLRKKPPI